ncbi:MAG TPA: DUF2243 domain-containing protein [Anaeromyxobacter sp.]|nr:DUF2243 domain-containing protein [Anaeromyxobacter sp.]
MRRSDGDDRAWLAAGVLVGIGMGGFVDGIVAHQLLQVHNMLSNRVPKDTIAGLEINMVWDGLFHAFCWIAVVVGLGMSWRALRRRASLPSGRSWVGAAILGWGIFNLVEGIVDHHLLEIHHVHQLGNHLLWDLVFLASGILLAVAGWAVVRSSRAPGAPDSAT